VANRIAKIMDGTASEIPASSFELQSTSKVGRTVYEGSFLFSH
jgi:hypothetical protein